MDKSADKALELLRQLAEKLGTTMEGLYPYFVRQAILEAWAALIAWTLVAGMVFVGGVFLLRSYKHKGLQQYDEDGDLSVVGIVLMFVSVAALIVAVAYNLTFLLNPEYHAIKEIVRLMIPK